MKKSILFLIVIFSMLLISVNSRYSGQRRQYATVNIEPGAAGYFTNAIHPFENVNKGTQQVYFSAYGTGTMMITIQFQNPGSTTWQNYRIISFPRIESGSFAADADTTIYFPFWTEHLWGINFTYKDLDDVDAVLNLGATQHPDSLTFDQLDDELLPYTLADSTVSFEKSHYNFPWMVWDYTANTVADGRVYYKITKSLIEVARIEIPGTPSGLRWRAGVLSGEYIEGSTTFGFDW